MSKNLPKRTRLTLSPTVRSVMMYKARFLTLFLCALGVYVATPCRSIGLNISAKQNVWKVKWSWAKPYPLAISEGQGNVGSSQLVICGGFLNFPGITKSCYKRKFNGNPNENWVKLASMPGSIGITHMATVSDGPNIYFIGGFLGKHPGKSVTTAFKLNVASNKWSYLPSLKGPRAGGGLIKVGIKLIFAGGVNRPTNSNKNMVDYGTVYELDLGNMSKGWTVKKYNMPNPRNHMAAVSVCQKHFFIGGQKKENEFKGNQATVNQYLPSSGKWVTKAPLPTGTGHISYSVLAHQGSCGIFVIGGIINGRKLIGTVWYYSVSADKWSYAGEFPRGVQTPICQLKWNKIICATGAGTPNNKKAAFIGSVY